MGETINKELIIVGSGPAGLKSAEMAARENIDYLVLERGEVGQGWKEIRPDMKFLSPCHPQRDWTSLSEKFPIWKMDVQRPYCSSAEFVNYLDAYADHFNLNIHTNSKVVEITHDGDVFIVHAQNGKTYSAPLLLAATGIFGNPFIPNIPGARNNNHVMHSHHYRSYKDFMKQKVLVVGAGNSAAEVAIDLCGWSMVYMVSRKELQYFSDTRKLYHIRGISESYLKELISMELIRYRAYQDIQYIDQDYVQFKDWSLNVHKVIFATGYNAHIDVLKNFKIRVNKHNYPEVSMSGESIQYPNLFFAGPLAYQTSSSLVIHGFIKYLPQTIRRITERLRNEGNFTGADNLDNNKASS